MAGGFCRVLAIPFLCLALGAGVAGAQDASPVPLSPEEGGPRHWRVVVSDTLNMREATGDEASVVARLPNGTMLDNLGCLRAETRVWCDVQQIGGGPRGYVAAAFLAAATAPDGSVPTGPDTSAQRAGADDFDARGQLPCAQAAGQPTGPCDFGVARASGGSATVVVIRPDGRTRAIFFRLGRPVGADTSEADPGEFRATREKDLNLVWVGGERYEIPDAVVDGG